MDNDNLRLFEGSNIITLGHFNLGCPIDNDFMKLAALKEIYIKLVSVRLLRMILLKDIYEIEFDVPYESIETYSSYISSYSINVNI
ncbi:hypothetical protein K502DRAFT_233656 [Neoconidiobolus thromboides FSU 785]|nr:hypothetical protein K502DRAFT_233656 [Neoconidiobolus thromboides FSU 785]